MLRPLVALFKVSEGNGIVVAKRHVLLEGNNCYMIDSCVRSIEKEKIIDTKVQSKHNKTVGSVGGNFSSGYGNIDLCPVVFV